MKKNLIYIVLALVAVVAAVKWKDILAFVKKKFDSVSGSASVADDTFRAPTPTPDMQIRGVRNNNPLNIRYSSKNDWKGQTGQDEKGFCVFSEKKWGLRAAFINLRTYVEKLHCNTVEDIITRWAPPSDNNPTEAYIQNVVANSGLFRSAILPFEYDSMAALVKAMTRVETCQVLTNAEMQEAWKLI